MSLMPSTHLARQLLLAAAIGTASVAVSADSEVRHLDLEPPETAAQAWKDLKENNASLAELMQKTELSAEDSDAAHMLSYPLENALAKLADDLAEIAVVLEEMHLASETADGDAVLKHGRAYLEAFEAFSAAR